MERRSFLKSAAAVLPAAGLKAFAFDPLSTSQSPDQGYVVDAGQDRLKEAHSLGFSTILFKTLPSETNGGLFVIEHTHLAKGGPPLHLHLHQEEWFYVMEGEMIFQVGDTRKQLHPGDSLLCPRGIPHTFSLIGDKPGRMLITFAPAGKMEAFFREAAVPNGPRLDADLFARHDMKLVGPPLVVG